MPGRILILLAILLTKLLITFVGIDEDLRTKVPTHFLLYYPLGKSIFRRAFWKMVLIWRRGGG